MVKKLFCLVVVVVLGVVFYLYLQNDKGNNNNNNQGEEELTYLSYDNIPTKNIEDLFKETPAYLYPENMEFTGTCLNNGKFYGEYRTQDGRFGLSFLDLESGQYHLINEFDGAGDMATIIIADKSDKYLFFEKYENEVSEIYLYDIEKNTIRLIMTYYNIPSLHYLYGSIYEDMILFNFYNVEQGVYHTYQYSILEDNITLVEPKNSGYPVYVNGDWYYLSIDNQNLKVQLIKYNSVSQEKVSIYETNGDKEYLMNLKTNGNELLFTLTSGSYYSFYLMNTDTLERTYLFHAQDITNLAVSGQYITWIGKASDPNRVRRQYYLYNLNEGVNYNNLEGEVYLDKTGIIWIDYLKEDNAIPKGEVHTNENTTIRYLKY